MKLAAAMIFVVLFWGCSDNPTAPEEVNPLFELGCLSNVHTQQIFTPDGAFWLDMMSEYRFAADTLVATVHALQTIPTVPEGKMVHRMVMRYTPVDIDSRHWVYQTQTSSTESWNTGTSTYTRTEEEMPADLFVTLDLLDPRAYWLQRGISSRRVRFSECDR